MRNEAKRIVRRVALRKTALGFPDHTISPSLSGRQLWGVGNRHTCAHCADGSARTHADNSPFRASDC